MSQCYALQFRFCFFCKFHLCPLDAQHFTAALVVVENLELALRISSIEAVEELLLLPNLKQLTLDVVSDHVNPLSIVSSPMVGVRPECSLFLGCSDHVMSGISSQKSFSNLQTTPHPKSVSNVRQLYLTLPPEGDTCLTQLICNCPLVEKLTLECNSKSEEEFLHACRDQVVGCSNFEVCSLLYLLSFFRHIYI